MSQTAIIFLILALLVPLWWLLRRDFIQGLCYAVFLCVSVSTYVRIEMPGGLPQLTIFRLVLLSVFIFWLRRRDSRTSIRSTPFSKAFVFWVLANMVSLLSTQIHFVTSLKYYLDFVLEEWGFYILIATSIRRREDGLRLLRSLLYGVTLVAILACVQKYTGWNPVDLLGPQDETGSRRDIVATYQHRILLGTGMAMGLPLAFAWMTLGRQGHRRLAIWMAIGLLAAASYFSQSRGPWLGACLASVVLLWLGSPWVRKGLVCLAALSLMVLVTRPGVWDTIFDKAEATLDKDSFKGGTYRYRLELWRVAWNEVSQSPLQLLFGYGPGCASEIKLEQNLSYRSNEEYEIWSWDNEFAYDLFQSGIVGLMAVGGLYLGVLMRIRELWKRAQPEDRDPLACLLASGCVFIFMMSNVLIFAKQLDFVFWTATVVALSFRFPKEELARQPAPTSDFVEAFSRKPKNRRLAYAP